MLTNRFTQLLVSLIALFVLAPFILKVEMDFPVVSFLFLVVILLTLRTLQMHRVAFYTITTLAFGAFLFECLINFHFIYAHKTLVAVITLSSFAIFLGIAILLMMRDLFSREIVSVDTVRGGISIYLLLGVFWGILFELIVALDPKAFVLTPGTVGGGDIRYMLFYYSFTSLTTLAYGDILPADEAARILSALEGIAGVLFLTVFVAQLVSLHVFAKSNKIKNQ